MWAAVALLLVVLGALAGVALGTSTFAVTAVRITGAAPDEVGAVRDVAAVAPGANLLRLDTAAVAARVRTLPRVAGVDVRRALPGTVVIRVSEREPVVATPLGPAVGLVDATGYAYRTAEARPPGVPLLRLPPGSAPEPADAATRAAVSVVTALPDDLRGSVTEVRAAGPFAVMLVLTGGRQVRWGDDAENTRKAAVLAALLSRSGSVYDVSAPGFATVS